jgi:hypothetical protein
MAVIALTQVLLARADDLTVLLPLEATSVEEDDELTGEVRTYAGGRRRSVTRAGAPNSLALSCDVIGRSTLNTLRGWKGQTLLYRDPRGRKLYGVFYRLGVSENITADLATVSFTLERVTRLEAV